MLIMKISIIVAVAITMVTGEDNSTSESGTDYTFNESSIDGSDASASEFLDPKEQEEEEIEEEITEEPAVSEGVGPSPPYWLKYERMIVDSFKARPAWKEVRFRCSAGGHPVPEIEWLKDGKPIISDGKMYEMNKWTLKMLNAIPSYSGLYTCIVRNKYGSQNFTFELDIISPNREGPQIRPGSLMNQTVYAGEDVRFQCDVWMTELSYHMQWFRQLNEDLLDGATPEEVLKEKWPQHQPHNWTCDKMVAKEFSVPTFECLTKSSVTGNQDVLVLRNVTVEQSGKYICWASNYLGVGHKSAWLTVLPTSNISIEVFTTDVYPEDNIDLPKEKGSHMYIIIAIVIVVVLVLAFAIYYIYCRFRRKSQRPGLARRQNPNSTAIQHQMSMESNSSVGSSQPLIRRSQRLSSNITSISEIEIPYDENWEFPRNRLTLGKTLGEGAFGQVFEASAMGIMKKESNTTTTTCAVKMLKADATERELNDLISEMEMMKQIGKHINIINLLGCCTQDGPLLVIVEYAPHGNLRDFLRSRRPQNIDYENAELLPKIDLLTNKDLVSFAYQIARGMSFLSLNKCVHRDLAARNVLVGKDHIMKIADFGLARDVHYIDYYRKNTNGRVPVKWMSPEALFDRVYTIQSDVWSFGILLWEIMTLGGSPYPSLPVEMLFDFLKAGKRMEQPHGCSSEIYSVMRDCWRTSPNQRPNFNQLVQTLDGLLTQSSIQDYLSLDALGDGPEVMVEYHDNNRVVEGAVSKNYYTDSRGHQYIQDQPKTKRLESTV
ncbi:fibroblast growth factor receptor 2-like isoform X2 [Ptychodera flava]|uniref:fibroblast growth factor receptor 2-like isoform X2 n=1 Tax=Ptychodera flava TaxID=63121 RepID=UPI00396A7FB4